MKRDPKAGITVNCLRVMLIFSTDIWPTAKDVSFNVLGVQFATGVTKQSSRLLVCDRRFSVHREIGLVMASLSVFGRDQACLA